MKNCRVSCFSVFSDFLRFFSVFSRFRMEVKANKSLSTETHARETRSRKTTGNIEPLKTNKRRCWQKTSPFFFNQLLRAPNAKKRLYDFGLSLMSGALVLLVFVWLLAFLSISPDVESGWSLFKAVLLVLLICDFCLLICGVVLVIFCSDD